MVKHNHMVPNNKLHKDWQRYIKCHFDQPLAKKHRAVRRRQRASTKAPRPAGKLRPIVTCPTQKYNMRLRAGRGFTLLELKMAGIKGGPRYARTIGIAVDTRRHNKSQESLARNVRRLKQYMQSLVLFPIRPTSAQRKDKEKMITWYMAQQKAKQRLTQYQRYMNQPLRVPRKKRAVTEVVDVNKVPVYDVTATLKNEWCLGKHHFKWRRRNIRLHHKKKLEAAKKAKKGAKGPKKDKKGGKKK